MGRPKKGIFDKKGKGRGRAKCSTQSSPAPEFDKPTDAEAEEEDVITHQSVNIEDDDMSVMSSAADGDFTISSSPLHTQPSTSTFTSRDSTCLPVDQSQGSASQNLSKKRKKAYIFTEQQESDLSEWYKDHDILYNRRHPESHNTSKKKAIIMDKTKIHTDTAPTYEQMLTWMDNMRTQFGRVTNVCSKSGRGTNQNLTPRDVWIKDTFDFLRPYIKRQQTRASSRFPDKERELEEFGELSGSEDDSIRKRNKTDTPQAVDAIDKLINRADELSVIRQNTEKTQNLTPQEDRVRKYVEYISTELIKIPEHLWLKYTMDHMGLVHSYIERCSVAQNTHKSVMPPMRINPYPFSQSTSQSYQYQHRPYNWPQQQQQFTGDIYRPSSLHVQSSPNQSSSIETDTRSSGALDLTSTISSVNSGGAQFSFSSLLNPNGQSDF